jgi:hypothetical protein
MRIEIDLVVPNADAIDRQIEAQERAIKGKKPKKCGLHYFVRKGGGVLVCEKCGKRVMP